MEKALNQLKRMVSPASGAANVRHFVLYCCYPLLNCPAGQGQVYTPMMKLVKVLLGISMPSEMAPLKNIVFFDPTLNKSQKAAVKFALESPEVACIHGPPGITAIYLLRGST
jgi:hypothetical protein